MLLRGLLLALAALAVLLAMHRYAWARLVRDTRLGRRPRIAVTAALVALGLSVPVAFVVGRGHASGGAFGFSWVAWTWFGFLYYCVLLLAGGELVRWWAKRRGHAARSAGGAPGRTAGAVDPDPDPPQFAEPDLVDRGRRVFLARAVAGGSLVGAAAATGRGVRQATGEITTPEVAVRLARLPRELDGYRIVQLSDLHLGPLLGASFLAHVVARANAQRPDLVVVTGDLVDGDVGAIAGLLDPFARLAARDGVAFVTGNHEYYSGHARWLEHLARRGWRTLVNERVAIGSGRASFDLAGVPDEQGALFEAAHAPDLDRALAGRDPERELVLLAHRPSQVALAEGRGVGLQLSGHTHGGQMWPFGALVGLVQPYVAGLHRHRDGCQVYVSRGTGFWGPPLRLAAPAEVATIVLTT